MIILYDYTETSFTSNGLGCLNDALKCEVTEELNGNYELEMEYPVNGIHYSDITLRRIILAKPNSYDREQPFRIYSISKPINGVVTINAEHISYDMSGFPVKGAIENYAWYVNDVFEHIRNNSVYTCPFTFSTDITEEKKEIDLSKPRSVRSYLGTDDGLLSLFGGEWEFDRYNATLHKERGANRGVSIEYGKNLIDLTQEEKCSEMYTAVYPFYYQEDDGLQYLDDDVVQIFESSYKKVLTLDLTSEFEEMPTQDELKEKTNEYIEENKLSEPAVSLTVSFIKNPEVIEALQDVRLGDTVGVRFVKIGVDTTSRCITYSFNAITEQYNSIELGEPTETIVDTVSQTSKQASDTSQALDDEVDRATESEQLILEEVDTVEKTLRSEITSGDGALQSQITQTASEISAEVSRATTAEGVITGQLSLKIDKDDDGTIISLINGSANKINFTASNMFTVDSPNFTIDSSGNVAMTGKITADSGRIGGLNITSSGLEGASGTGSLRNTKIWMNSIETDFIDCIGIATDEIYSDSSNTLEIGVSNNTIKIWGDTYLSGPAYVSNPGTSTAAANTRIQDGRGRLAITTESSERFKHDIVPVCDYNLDPHRLYDVNVMQYKYNLDYVDPLDSRYDVTVIGFIAEDIYEKYPIAAEVDSTGNVNNWHERYIIPPMLALIQEQHKEIEDLKSAVMSLKGEIDILKQKVEE